VYYEIGNSKKSVQPEVPVRQIFRINIINHPFIPPI